MFKDTSCVWEGYFSTTFHLRCYDCYGMGELFGKVMIPECSPQRYVTWPRDPRRDDQWVVLNSIDISLKLMHDFSLFQSVQIQSCIGDVFLDDIGYCVYIKCWVGC